MTHIHDSTGCGEAGCHCSQAGTRPEDTVATVNGMALHAAGARPAPEPLRERLCAELLRQAAVAQGLLPAVHAAVAPTPSAEEQRVIEAMIDAAVTVPPPDEAACWRYYHRDATRFRVGQSVQVRHILFAVTPWVDVHALRRRAEQVLQELIAAPQRFAERAAELSNCPSGAQGGDLGWIGPQDCAPELSGELFAMPDDGALGVQPRLLRSRFGLHIVEVLAREPGRQPDFEEVRERIAAELAVKARLHATRLYLDRLLAEAELSGLTLEETAG